MARIRHADTAVLRALARREHDPGGGAARPVAVA